MRVSEVMTTKVVTVTPDTPFKEVVERLVHAEVSGLPVIDEHGALVGLITEADVISKEAYGGRHRALAVVADFLSGRPHHWVSKADGSVAGDFMTTNLVVCHRDDDVRLAARRMLQRGIKRMPVVDGGRLVGIISRRDVLAIFDRTDAAIADDLELIVSDRLSMPDESSVRFAIDQGVIILDGCVRYPWDEQTVVALVRSVPGVIDVISRLGHREQNPSPGPPEMRLYGAR